MIVLECLLLSYDEIFRTFIDLSVIFLIAILRERVMRGDSVSLFICYCYGIYEQRA